MTAIPKTVKGATYKIVYLIDTINGKEQILQNYNAINYSYRWKLQVVEDLRYFTMNEDAPQIVVITYAKFGTLLEQDLDFHSHFDFIICDELPSLPKFEGFSPGVNHHTIAIKGIESAVRNGRTTVIALSATPNLIYRAFDVPFYEIPIDQDEVRHYETKDYIQFSSIENLIQSLCPSETGLCYVYRVRTMKTLEEKARELGFNPISIWSVNNKDHIMSEDQLAARASILKDFTLPPQYNLLFINASSETSLKIKSPVDYVIVDSLDPDTQVQVRGRVNSDLSRLYIPTDELTKIFVPDSYINAWLFKADRDKLCANINLRNGSNRQYGWPTIRKILEECGYTVFDGRWNNRRYNVIFPPGEEPHITKLE